MARAAFRGTNPRWTIFPAATERSAAVGPSVCVYSDGCHSSRRCSAAAKNAARIAARINLFRYRVPEEFYDLEKDPDYLNNLVDQAVLQPTIQSL
jgi:hypothetical protein